MERSTHGQSTTLPDRDQTGDKRRDATHGELEGPREKNTEDASEESVPCNRYTKEQSIEIQFHGSSGDRFESLLQSSDLEPGSRPAATTTGDITSDTGRQLGQSTIELEDLVGHHGDGLWRRDDSPVISNGGTDESREDPQCDDPGWNE